MDGLFESEAELLKYFMIAYISLSVFAVLATTRFTRSKSGFWKPDIKSSKTMVGLGGVFLTQCGVITAYGVVLYATGNYNSLAILTPFLVSGTV